MRISPAQLDERRDYAIAQHIVSIHQHGSLAHSGNEPDFSLTQLQQYIKYARGLKPRMSPEAARKLVEYYRELRQASESDAHTGSYRVTVRQLEAMVRLGEARARVDLEAVISVRHVQEARRLLRESIAKVDHDEVDVDIFGGDDMDEEIMRMAAEAEAAKLADQAEADGSAGGGAGRSAEMEGVRRAKTVSYEKYKKVERSLCVYVRGGESEPGSGLRQHDIVEWYLNQQEDISNLEDLAEERRLVRQIIQRLLTADKILVQVETPEDADEPTEGLRAHDLRYLTVRPHVEL